MFGHDERVLLIVTAYSSLLNERERRMHELRSGEYFVLSTSR